MAGTWGARSFAGAALAAALIAGAGVFRGALTGDRVLSGGSASGNPVVADSMVAFEPWFRFAADHLARDGRLPLWKDTASCGAPLLGNAQSALLFPPNLVYVLLGAPAGGLVLLALLKFALAFTGAALLARHLGARIVGSLVAGFVFAAGGFSTLYALFPLTNASSLLPWLLLAVDRLMQRATPGRTAALAVAGGLLYLSGHPETTFHCMAAACALALGRALWVGGAHGPAVAWARAGAVAGGLALGALLGAAQVLPFLEYVAASDVLVRRAAEPSNPFRSTLGLAAAFLVALGACLWCGRALADSKRRALPWALAFAVALLATLALRREGAGPAVPATLLAADWLGVVSDPSAIASYVANNQAYVGPALALALAGWLFGRPRRTAGVLALIFVLALLVAYEDPLLTPLLELLPPFDLSVNSRVQLAALLAAALLAGLGADALVEPGATPRRGGARLALAGVAVAAACVASLAVDVARAHAYSMPLAGPLQAAEPLRAGVLNAGVAGSDLVVQGWFALPAPPEDAIVLHGAAGAAPARFEAVTDLGGADDARLPESADPLYAFHARLPLAEIRDPGAGVRLLITAVGGGTWLSARLAADGTAWAAFAAAAGPVSRSAWLQLGLLAGALLLAILARSLRGRAAGAAGAAALALSCGGLGAFAEGFHPTVPRDRHFVPGPVVERLRGLGPDARYLAGPGLPSEVGTWFGLKEAGGYDALMPRRTALLLRAALAGGQPLRIEQLRWSEAADARLLGLLAVQAIVRSVEHPAPGTRLFPGGVVVSENPAFLPRARLVPKCEVEPDDARALARLREPDFDPARTVVLAEGSAGGSDAGSAGSAEIAAATPDRVEVAIRATDACHLVLADSWFPGWNAYVDGEPRPLLRADVALRAVRVGPADRTVVFRYEPASYTLGLAVTASAGAAVALLLLLEWRRRRRARKVAAP